MKDREQQWRDGEEREYVDVTTLFSGTATAWKKEGREERDRVGMLEDSQGER